MADESEQTEENVEAARRARASESAAATTRSLTTSFVWAMCAGWSIGFGNLIAGAVFIWCAGFSSCQAFYRWDRYCRLRDGVPL